MSRLRAAVKDPASEHLRLMAQAVAARVQFAEASDPLGESYSLGVSQGMYQALYGGWQDVRLAAEQAHYTTVGTLPNVREYLAWLPITDTARADAAWASGVLWGFRKATEDEDDAEKCTACDHRVLTDRDELACHCDQHGWSCSPDCQRSVCNPLSSTCARSAA